MQDYPYDLQRLDAMDLESAAKMLPDQWTHNRITEIPTIKFFVPWGSGSWWASEYDPERRDMFGLADLGFPELGYFNLDEMLEIRGPHGLRLEIDLYWTGSMAEAKIEAGVPVDTRNI